MMSQQLKLEPMKEKEKGIMSGRYLMKSALGMRISFVIALAILLITATSGKVSAAGLLKQVGGDDTGIFISSHKVDVLINNGFVRTEVDQIFANNNDYDMEAVYTFPLPKKASLSELSLWIDGKEIIGEVVEKERARKIYEDQKNQGNDTALAEQNDFKTFDVMIGRIQAGGETRVRLVYYQPNDIDLNVGRYLYPLAEGNVDDERIAFWSVDDNVSGAFSFHLLLKSAFPIADVRMPGLDDEAVIRKVSETEEESSTGDIYEVTLEYTEGASLSKDIIFYYRLDDSVPARLEVIPYKEGPNDEGTFMAVVTPAADLKRITEGKDWVFILDVSGSMGGQKIATLANGVSKVLGKMPENDRFNIVTFNNSANNFTPGYVTATKANVQKWIQRIKTIQAGGGTDVYSGLKKAYRRLDDDRTTSIILVTDGVANVGETRQKAFLKLLNAYDIRLFTFIIGNSANEPLLQRLAEDSGGFAMNISDSDDIAGKMLQARTKILFECLHDVELKFSGENVTDLTPVDTPNLYMGQQLVVFGHYNGSGKLNVSLSAKVSGEDRSWSTSVFLPDTDKDNPELERLWALSSIEDAMRKIREDGENESLRQKVVSLGTEYSLVTDYTSMIVVEDDVMENEGIQRNNAERVRKERNAQNNRFQAPVKQYRVDNTSNNGGMFNGRSAPGIGSGPVGPLFIPFAYWLRRRRSKK